MTEEGDHENENPVFLLKTSRDFNRPLLLQAELRGSVVVPTQSEGQAVDPGAIAVDEEGEPLVYLNHNIVKSLVAAVQHCHEGLKRRVEQEARLQGEIDALNQRVDDLLETLRSIPNLQEYFP